MRIKLILSCFVALLALLHFHTPTHANEGHFYLESNLNNDSRCLAYSVEVKTNEYNLLVTCRGLVYPPLPPDSDSYILWADGGDKESPAKLTNLLFGKGFATTKGKFNRLFVTLERGNPKQPTGRTIMSATLLAYQFDTRLIEPTPADNVSISNDTPPIPTATLTPQRNEPSVSFWRTGLGKIIIIITAGFLIFLFILMVYGKRK